MFLSRLSVRRPVLVTVLVGFFVVFGLVAAPKMPVELLPDVELPYLMVTVGWPGAGPEDVENAVVLPLEERLGRVNHVEKVWATAAPDGGRVLLQLALGTDTEQAAEEVRSLLEDVDRVLPAGAWRPRVQEVDLNAAPVLLLAVEGDLPPAALTTWVEDHLEVPLSRVAGVASVELAGDRHREVEVAVDSARMARHRLTLAQVVTAVRAGGVDIPAGSLEVGGEAVPVRVAAAYESAADVAATLVRSPVGELVPLTAVATVTETLAPAATLARVDGAPAVGVAIYKRSEANTVALGRALEAQIRTIEAELPDGIRIQRVQDASEAIRVSIRDLVATLALCILLTASLLRAFLQDWRGTVVVAAAIPCALVGSLTFVYLAGFTINYMTLMGLAITVGTLVDASIVVLEGIAREAEDEPDAAVAADRGTARVWIGVVGSTVTNIVVFAPIAFMQGIVGRFFVQFALTVTFSMVLALLVSFTLTPMLAARLYRGVAGRGAPTARSGRLGGAWDRAYQSFVEAYRRVLRWSLAHRAAAGGGLLALFLGAVFLLAPVVPLGWFTSPDQGFFLVQVAMPRDSALDRTRAATEQAEAVLRAHPDVATVYAEVGRQATLVGKLPAENHAELHVVLRSGAPSTRAVMAVVRPRLARAVPGARILVKELGGGETAIRDDLMLELTGPDPDVLAHLADRVEAFLHEAPNLVDIHRSGDEAGVEVRVRPDDVRLAREGLSAADLGRLLRVAVEGDTDAAIRRDGGTDRVRVRLAGAERRDAAVLAAMPLQVPSGALVPLRDLARLEEVTAPRLITRQDRTRRVTLTANLEWGAIGNTAAALEDRIRELEIPTGYLVRVGGEEEQRAEAAAEIGAALGLAVVLVVLLLAGLLESFVHPFTILATLPLALIGVLLALAATGVDLDIFGLMATVMLVGIVVNNAILLIEETGHQRAGGRALADALEQGALRRLRPILMTSLSTVAGMLPLALGLGAGAELRQSMALVSIGGVGVSSVLVLVACPVLYHGVEDLRDRRRARRHPAGVAARSVPSGHAIGRSNPTGAGGAG